MKHILLIATCTLAVSTFSVSAHAASLIGATFGFPSAKGQKSNKAYSGSNSYSFVFGINGTNSFSFESGYTQLVDIEEKFDQGQKLEVSVGGLYISGRYSKQFGVRSFGYAKLGAYRWNAIVTETSSSDDSVIEKADNTSKIDGFSPLLALGADFLVVDGSDISLRVEFEHVNNLGGGARLESPNRERDVSEGYEYNRFAVGVMMAL